MSSAQFWPPSAHGAYSSALRRPSCVAPAATRSSRVALPSWIFLTRPAFVVVGSGTRQTLASYRSRQTAPAATASGPQRRTWEAGKPAAAALTVSAKSEAFTAPNRLVAIVEPSVPGASDTAAGCAWAASLVAPSALVDRDAPVAPAA